MKLNCLCKESFEEDNEKVLFYTGFPNWMLLRCVFNFVKDLLQSSKGVLTPFQKFLMGITAKYSFPFGTFWFQNVLSGKILSINTPFCVQTTKSMYFKAETNTHNNFHVMRYNFRERLQAINKPHLADQETIIAKFLAVHFLNPSVGDVLITVQTFVVHELIFGVWTCTKWKVHSNMNVCHVWPRIEVI